MTTHTKEEQERLEEKIARIQKKEEEILRRKKEIEEDIRLAEQKDALVKLRPSTTNLSRERTPALKPSNRELREDFSDESFQEPVVQKSSRDSFRGRGVERYRGQGDWKTTGPPPDPKSFLYDDERDAPSRDKEGKEDLRQKLDRRNRDDREGELRGGGREFQRGGRRGAGNDTGSRRGSRGRRGGAGEDTAWRAERLRIDEARIERQKAADGRWRREWDNEKVDPQFEDDQPMFEQRRDLEQRRGCPQHHQHDHRDHHHDHHDHRDHHHDHHHHHHGHHDHHDHRDHQHGHHGPSYVPASVPRQLPREVHGRGRGRFDPAQLEMPLDGLPHIEVLRTPGAAAKESTPTRPRQSTPVERPPSPQMKVRGSPRSVECVGTSVKISIANASPPKSMPKGQRSGDRRPRPQPSYSSQSDEDSPRDRAQRRQRAPRHQRNHQHQRTLTDRKEDGTAPLSKPPLPPFRAEPKAKEAEVREATINAAGDDSWEDVTTSGAESMGEETPVRAAVPESVAKEKTPPVDQGTDASLNISNQPSDQPFDEYLNQVKSDRESSLGVERYVGNGDTSLHVTHGDDLGADECQIKALEMSDFDLKSAQDQFDDKYVVVDEKRSDMLTSDPSTAVGASDTNLSKSANALVADDLGGVVVSGDGEDKDSVSVGDGETKLSGKQILASENCDKNEVIIGAGESLNDTVELKISHGEKDELEKTSVSDASSKEQNVCENVPSELTNNDKEK